MNHDAQSFSLKYWLDYIDQLHPQDICLGLERIKQVAQAGQLDHFDGLVIIVGGTNGKGSTVAATAKLLEQAGLKVGAYFSPHLLHFNERVAINAIPVLEPVLCRAFAEIERLRQSIRLTFFEYTTLAALLIFKQAQCDAIVLEIGLGGRLDAVNMLTPSLSILTTIGLDHTDRLGTSLAQIAVEKAGILRANVPAIIGTGATHPVVLAQAKALTTPVYIEQQDFAWQTSNYQYWQFRAHTIKVPLNALPPNSVSLALAALQVLKPRLPQRLLNWDLLNLALRHAQLPGRFQRFLGKVETIFDVAHNQQGAKWLAQRLQQLKPRGKCYAVWSGLQNKDLPSVLKALTPYIDHWWIAPLNDSRAAKLPMLEAATAKEKLRHITWVNHISEAYQQAQHYARAQDRIVVFGSFITVAQVMRSVEQDLIYMNTFYVREDRTNLKLPPHPLLATSID